MDMEEENEVVGKTDTEEKEEDARKKKRNISASSRPP